jgi:hypothetical protein
MNHSKKSKTIILYGGIKKGQENIKICFMQQTKKSQ